MEAENRETDLRENRKARAFPTKREAEAQKQAKSRKLQGLRQTVLQIRKQDDEERSGRISKGNDNFDSDSRPSAVRRIFQEVVGIWHGMGPTAICPLDGGCEWGPRAFFFHVDSQDFTVVDACALLADAALDNRSWWSPLPSDKPAAGSAPSLQRRRKTLICNVSRELLPIAPSNFL
ncbi:hypothetical protein ACLOJK_009950 [Asimina triloba]